MFHEVYSDSQIALVLPFKQNEDYAINLNKKAERAHQMKSPLLTLALIWK